jgi:hypothetical protein
MTNASALVVRCSHLGSEIVRRVKKLQPFGRCQEGLYSFAPKYWEQPAATGGASFGANDVELSGQRGTRDELLPMPSK